MSRVASALASATSRTGWKLRIKPSEKSVAAIKEKLREQWRSLPGQSMTNVLRTLNPIIRGWANYHRRGIATAIDGPHAVAQLPLAIDRLEQRPPHGAGTADGVDQGRALTERPGPPERPSTSAYAHIPECADQLVFSL